MLRNNGNKICLLNLILIVITLREVEIIIILNIKN